MAFSFGATGSPAPQNTGFATPASTPSLFGGAATPAFGATPAASTPAAATPAFGAAPSFGGAASTPSMFGATSAPQGTGLFGAPSPAATTATFNFAGGAAAGTGLFGGATLQQQQQPGGLFGNAGAAGATTTQMAPATFSGGPAAQPDFSATRELMAIKDAFVPGSDKYRLHYLFLNVVTNPAARVKPPNVDDLRWREAMQRAGGAENPDNLWPVLATGFGDLLARKAAQDEAMEEHARRLDSLVDAARQLARKQETALHERLEAVKRRHLQLTLGLLGLMRQLDAVESRLGAATGHRQGAAAREATATLQRQLTELEAAVMSADGLKRRVENAASSARLRGGLPYGSHLLAGADGAVDVASLEQAFGALQQHTEALSRIKDVLRRDERDLAIIMAADSEANGNSGSANGHMQVG